MLPVLLLLAHSTDTQSVHVTVGGVDRNAIIVAPSKLSKQAPPVLFMFHGLGGSSQRCASRFHFSEVWPEAIVVYPDGSQVSRGNQSLGKGWHIDCNAKNVDIQFVDALCVKLEAEYHADPKQVFAAGFSNGGMFVYTLWTMRPERFAGFCPSGAALATDDTKLTVPKPAFVTVSGNDDVVPASYQRQGAYAAMKVNSSVPPGTPYGSAGTYYKGTQPLVRWAYNGGHEFPFEAFSDLVRFFKSVTPPASG